MMAMQMQKWSLKLMVLGMVIQMALGILMPMLR